MTEELKMKTCPCCGKETLVELPKPSEQLMEHYMACIVTGVPFSYEYDLYDGAISITVVNPTAEEAASMRKTVPRLYSMNMDAGKPLDPGDMQTIENRLQTYSLIQEIRIKSNNRAYRPKDEVEACLAFVNEAYEESKEDEYKGTLETALNRLTNGTTMSGLPLQVLVGTIAAHSQVYDLLVGNGLDKNFWERISLA
jgi:hypothetical protein